MTMLTRILLALLLVPHIATGLWADGPADNSVDNVRPVPPLGIELSEQAREELGAKLLKTAQQVMDLRKSSDPFVQRYLPDVEVLYRAVDQAFQHQEMFREQDAKDAAELLQMADDRASQLKEGFADWTKQSGLVVRGFRSELDGTVQPYGLEIAKDYNFDHPRPVRCDIWFHGRGENSLELQFLSQLIKRPGPYPPITGIVLHPFGRYSNAFKFAGEVDTLEALEHVKQNYAIDEDRISVRGFSMGGAACWQFAVHYADRWFAANPGAGFSETPEFLKSFQGETLDPPWFEERLWRMYDCNLWAENIRQVPTVAYSGEIDRQKQAADVMEQACLEHAIGLTHIIGPQTAHQIHPDSNKIIRAKLDSLSMRGRQRFPQQVHLTTFTLKYNRMNWITVHALQEHWMKSTIDAQIVHGTDGPLGIDVVAKGVTGFSIDFPSGFSPFDVQQPCVVSIDGERMPLQRTNSDLSLSARFQFVDGQWKEYEAPADQQLRKQHDLQGPIDDALMQPFLFVQPSGDSGNTKVTAWADAELKRAIKEWRRQMRGDVRIKSDADVNEEDIANYHLILWGTPLTNSIIGRIVEQLPLRWKEDGIQVRDATFDTADHALAMIYPNPLNPSKYIVLNSSFTYREYDYLNNARQTAKLPDWAVIDVRTPPNARWPGKIVDADFFDEQWQVKLERHASTNSETGQ